MRKVVLMLLAAALLAAPVCGQAAGAARLGAEWYAALPEAGGEALIRIPADGEAKLVARAEEMGAPVAMNGLIYFLAKSDGQWKLYARVGASDVREVYAYPAGAVARSLTAADGSLLMLVDDVLHQIEPGNGLCLKLLGDKMREFAVADGAAYFVSDEDTIEYIADSLSGSGEIRQTEGCLYRLNLKTGATTVVIKAGVDGLQCFGGALYFHNYGDHYVVSDGETESLAGRLFRFTLADEKLARLLSDYDWGYFPLTAGIAVYTREKLVLYAADGPVTLAQPTEAALAFSDGESVIVYEPSEMTLTRHLPDGSAEMLLDAEAAE